MPYTHSLRLARRLIQINNHTVADILIEEYNKPTANKDIKIGIINVLGLFPTENVINLLKKELLNNTDPAIRAAAAISLGRKKDPQRFEILREALIKEEHPSVKRNIVSAAGKFPLSEAKILMKEIILTETEPSIKAIIIQNIVQMGWKDLVPILRELESKERHPKVKHYLKEALKVLT